MLSIGKQLKSKEEALEFNRKIYEFRANTKGHPGCIGNLACENCFRVVSDLICLCVGIFTCPNCNFENGKEKLSMREQKTFKSIGFVSLDWKRYDASNPPPAKEGWNHSDQVLVFYEVSAELQLANKFGIAYYHYSPPFKGEPCWVDFDNADREPKYWWKLPKTD